MHLQPLLCSEARAEYLPHRLLSISVTNDFAGKQKVTPVSYTYNLLKEQRAFCQARLIFTGIIDFYF